MVNLILELSKYVMIFLMAVYTWANFRYFSFPDRERKLRLCARQNHVMFFMHFLAYMTLFLKAEDEKTSGLLCSPGCVFPGLYFPYAAFLPECFTASGK